ncbi:deacetylase [Klebsiella pneumoniae]|uniref:Deacetylase n=1 Tax=Klebsiella pneumoniae TaxID=573 RepID=A0A2X3FR78_KLEPN|nr:deacetylase [Klebsiella pneumoniae]
MHNPAFLITIDTEGDNLWQKHDSITTENARYLPRFQQLCEKYGFKPVYLTNYEMAIDPFYIEFARDVIARGTAEVGMHLHAWNSPPTEPLTADDWRHKPYLIEYSDAMMREKVDYMTRLLEDTFQTKMVSHRAGRWAFDERYARLLVEYGYQVDCSVTPRVNWKTAKGAPQGDGRDRLSPLSAACLFPR